MVILSLLPLALFFHVVAGITREGCRDGWTFYSQSCYQFVPQKYDFYEAKGICTAKGSGSSYLASLWKKEEYEFVRDVLWNTIKRGELAWVGLYHRTDRRKGYIWHDGSSFDSKSIGKTKESPDDKRKCGALASDGTIKLRYCSDVLSALICKQPLDMTYIVSDAFNTTYPVGGFGLAPERLLFERVWAPKLLYVPKHVNLLTTTQVTHETDCAYKCFHVDDCRAFTLKCLLYAKCNLFSCDLFSPKYMSIV